MSDNTAGEDGATEKRFRADRPKSNPAGIKARKNVTEAFKAIKAKATLFISRDDRPGTHIVELDLWKAAAIDIDRDKGPWYRSIG